MKKLMIAMAVLGVGAWGVAQDEPKDMAKKTVERPIKESLRSPEVEKFDLAKTGIDWHKGLDAATGKGKPVLLFQLLGNLDDVHC